MAVPSPVALSFLAERRSCRAKCKSLLHVSDLAVAASKLSDEQAMVYLLTHCRTAWKRSDAAGRSLVHWAASRGQADLLDWLIGRLGATFGDKDSESGYTPLHRALLHGRVTCAAILLDYEAPLSGGPLDAEGLTPLELLRADGGDGGFSLKGLTELYSYGENASYNLGHSHPSQRLVAEPVDALRRAGVRPAAVAMAKFHTLLLSQAGEVFACGHGLGGRLGLGDESPSFWPKRVVLGGASGAPVAVVALAAARNHSLFVGANGWAYATGANQYRQLGLGAGVREDQVLQPTQVSWGKAARPEIVGAAGSSFHSVLWSKSEAFVCGLNAGQIGLAKTDSPVVPAPKAVSFAYGKGSVTGLIQSMGTSEGATALATTLGEVFLFTNWERLRVASRLVNIVSVAVTGGKLKPLADNGDYGGRKEHLEIPGAPLRLVVLTEAGHLFHWHDGERVLRRVLFTGAPRSTVFPTQVPGAPLRLVVLTEAGHLFHWHDGERVLRRVLFTGAPRTTVFPTQVPGAPLRLVVLTEAGHLFHWHDGERVLRRVLFTGAPRSTVFPTQVPGAPLRLVVLTEAGHLFHWHDGERVLRRVLFTGAPRSTVFPTQVPGAPLRLVVLTEAGHLFHWHDGERVLRRVLFTGAPRSTVFPTQVPGAPLRLVVLTEAGHLFHWHDGERVLRRVLFTGAPRSTVFPTQVPGAPLRLVVLTEAGHLFHWHDGERVLRRVLFTGAPRSTVFPTQVPGAPLRLVVLTEAGHLFHWHDGERVLRRVLFTGAPRTTVFPTQVPGAPLRLVVLTEAGHLFHWHDGERVLRRVLFTGAPRSTVFPTQVPGAPLRLVVLTEAGHLFHWHDGERVLRRVLFTGAPRSTVFPTQVPGAPLRLVVLTEAGHLFHWHDGERVLRRVLFTGAPRTTVFPTQVPGAPLRLVVLTEAGHLFHWHDGERVLRRVLFTGAPRSTVFPTQVPGAPLRLVVLTEAGHLFHWHDGERVLRRVLFTGAPRSTVFPTQMHLYKRGVLLSLPDGRAMRGAFGPLRRPVSPQAEGQAPAAKAEGSAAGSRNRKKSEGKGGQKSSLAFAESRFLDAGECQPVALTRVAHVHRCLAAASDPSGANFAFILQDPSERLTSVPLVAAGELSADLGRLLEDALEGDGVADIVLRLGAKRWALHRMVLAQRCPELAALVGESAEWEWSVEALGSVTPQLLHQLLLFLYTDTCPLLSLGTQWDLELGVVESSPSPASPPSAAAKRKRRKGAAAAAKEEADKPRMFGKQPLRQMAELAKRLGLPALVKKTELLLWEPLGECRSLGAIRLAPHVSKAGLLPRARLERSGELADVRLLCDDGTELTAHRAVLVARLPYFRVMLLGCGVWREAGSAEAQTLRLDFPGPIATAILHYAYTDTLPAESRRLGRAGESRRTEFPERLVAILVAADQLLVERLRSLAEAGIASVLSLRNVAELIECAGRFNAPQLKEAALQFAALNLCALLEAGSLAGLSRDSLDAVGDAYRQLHPHVAQRRLTPCLEPPSLGSLLELVTEAESLGLGPEELAVAVLSKEARLADEPKLLSTKEKEPPPKPTPPPPDPTPPEEDEWRTVGRGGAGRITDSLAGLSLDDSPPAEPKPSPPLPPTPAQPSVTSVQAASPKASDKAAKSKKKWVVWTSVDEEDRDLNDNDLHRKTGWEERGRGNGGNLVNLRDVMSAEAASQPPKPKPSRPVPVTPSVRRSWGPVAASPISSPTADAFPSLGSVGSPASPPAFVGAGSRSFSQIQAEEAERQAQSKRQASARLDAIQIEESAMAELLQAYGADSPEIAATQLISVARCAPSLPPAQPLWSANVTRRPQ